MAATASTLEAILNSLVAGFGKEAVQKACLAFAVHSSTKGEASPTPSAAAGGKVEKPAKKVKFAAAPLEEVEKPAKKARGKSSWNLYVDEVLAEMKLVEPSTTYRLAFAEASRRRRETDPEAQKKYEAYKAKKEAKRAAKAAGEAVSSSSESGSTDGSDEE